VTFASPWTVKGAQKVNILENPQGDLPVKDNGVEVNLKPFQMVSIRLTPWG